MAKSRKPAGVGHNSQLADPNDIQTALARQLMLDKELDDLKERHKRIRKGFEQSGVSLARLDKWKKLVDKPVADIEREFREDFHYAGVAFPDLGEQFNLFAPKAEAPERRAAFYHKGRMAALKGDEPTPPPGISGDDLQRWQSGYNDHLPFYQKAKSEQAEFMAKALENAENGIVTDGTGTAEEKKTRAVRQQARKDFAEDNPGVDLGEASNSGQIIPADDAAEQASEEDGDDAPAIDPNQDPEPLPDPLEVDGIRYPNQELADEARAKTQEPVAPSVDPRLIVNGVTYPNLTRANQARQAAEARAARASGDEKKLSQSEKAAAKRKAAGL